MIAGKGHEQGQEFKDGYKIPFDDATVVREILGVAPAVPEPRADEALDSAAGRRGGRRKPDHGARAAGRS